MNHHHPPVSTVLVGAGCCVEGHDSNASGASGRLQDKSCHSTGAGGLDSPPVETRLMQTAQQIAEKKLEQTERAGPRGQIVILGLLSDRRLHRCGDDELHQWLITRVARGGDDRRSPEQN